MTTYVTGKKTIHTEHGIPIAVNVGDYLLGLGYKLIADLPVNPDKIAAMLKVASRGHTDLCLGQGKELVWMRDKAALTVDDVIDIFTKKTSPAFTVALKFGAILSGANQDTLDVLQQYSDALGIAYQIRDDIADFNSGNEDGLSLIDVLTQKTDSDTALKTAYSMLADYKHTAIDSLAGLQNTTLKGLLRRVITKIFDDTKKMECCDDYKTKFDTLSEGSKTNSG